MTTRTFTPFPVLKTDRLMLRQLIGADATAIFVLRSDENVNRYLNRQPSQSIEDAKTFIHAINENIKANNTIYWAIVLHDKLIGTICLFNFAGNNDKAEIGYELLPSYQGQGFMQEALVVVLSFAFQHIGLNKIEAYTHAENQNSTKLLEKVGFKNQISPDKNLFLFELSKQ